MPHHGGHVILATLYGARAASKGGQMGGGQILASSEGTHGQPYRARMSRRTVRHTHTNTHTLTHTHKHTAVRGVGACAYFFMHPDLCGPGSCPLREFVSL